MASANKRFARPVDVARVLAAPRLEVTETLLVGQAGLEKRGEDEAHHECLYTSARRRRRPARPPRSVVPTKRAANRRRPAVAMSRVTPWSRKFPRSRSSRVRRDRARPYRTRTRGGQTQGLWRATGATPTNEPLCRLARACPLLPARAVDAVTTEVPPQSTHFTQKTMAPPRLAFHDLGLTVKGKDGGPKAIVQGISASIAGRRVVAIMGPSGAGKTTLLCGPAPNAAPATPPRVGAPSRAAGASRSGVAPCGSLGDFANGDRTSRARDALASALRHACVPQRLGGKLRYAGGPAFAR